MVTTILPDHHIPQQIYSQLKTLSCHWISGVQIPCNNSGGVTGWCWRRNSSGGVTGERPFTGNPPGGVGGVLGIDMRISWGIPSGVLGGDSNHGPTSKSRIEISDVGVFRPLERRIGLRLLSRSGAEIESKWRAGVRSPKGLVQADLIFKLTGMLIHLTLFDLSLG